MNGYLAMYILGYAVGFMGGIVICALWFVWDREKAK